MKSWSNSGHGPKWSSKVGFVWVVIATLVKPAIAQEPVPKLEPSLVVSRDWCTYEVTTLGQMDRRRSGRSSDRLPSLEFLRHGTCENGSRLSTRWADLLVAVADSGGHYETRFVGTGNSVVPQWEGNGVQWLERRSLLGDESTVLVTGKPVGILRLDVAPGGVAFPLGTRGRFLVGHPHAGFDIVEPGSGWSQPLWDGWIEASTPYFGGSTPDRVRIAGIVTRAVPISAGSREEVAERKLIVWNGNAEIIYEDSHWTRLERQAYQVLFVNQGSRVICWGLGSGVAGEEALRARLVDVDRGESTSLPGQFRFEHVYSTPEGELLLGYGSRGGVATAKMFEFRDGAVPELMWEVTTPGRPSSCAISDDLGRCVLVFVDEELGFRVYSAGGELLAEGMQNRDVTTWAARFVDHDTLVLGALPSPWIRGWMRTLGRQFRFYDLRAVGGG